jgi:hypothetical protein
MVYTNKECDEAKRLGTIEGLNYRLDNLIKLNKNTKHELDDEIYKVKREIESLEQ